MAAVSVSSYGDDYDYLPKIPDDVNGAIKMTLATWVVAEDAGLKCQQAISWNAPDRPGTCKVFHARLKWAQNNLMDLADMLESKMPTLTPTNKAQLSQLNRVSDSVNRTVFRINQILGLQP